MLSTYTLTSLGRLSGKKTFSITYLIKFIAINYLWTREIKASEGGARKNLSKSGAKNIEKRRSKKVDEKAIKENFNPFFTFWRIGKSTEKWKKIRQTCFFCSSTRDREWINNKLIFNTIFLHIIIFIKTSSFLSYSQKAQLFDFGLISW